MRTNIEIDEGLLRQAMKATGQTTKKATVEVALRQLVESDQRRRAISKLVGKVHWEGDLDAWRERDRDAS